LVSAVRVQASSSAESRGRSASPDQKGGPFAVTLAGPPRPPRWAGVPKTPTPVVTKEVLNDAERRLRRRIEENLERICQLKGKARELERKVKERNPTRGKKKGQLIAGMGASPAVCGGLNTLAATTVHSYPTPVASTCFGGCAVGGAAAVVVGCGMGIVYGAQEFRWSRQGQRL
ncbi:unnamed protein product, partial [Amoebophrya sp. A120]